jgi:hypothetical protein
MALWSGLVHLYLYKPGSIDYIWDTFISIGNFLQLMDEAVPKGTYDRL